MRRSHVQHDNARVPRRTPFWPKPQKGAKTLFPVHPAALINEPPAPHRERQVAAKGGMLQTRSRPQSCGFRPPVLITTAKRQRAPDVGRPTCGAPDAAESVEQKPLPPHAAGVGRPPNRAPPVPLSLYTRIADYSVTCVTSFFRNRLYACLTAFSFVPTLSATSCHLSPSTWRRSRICRIRLSSTLSM